MVYQASILNLLSFLNKFHIDNPMNTRVIIEKQQSPALNQ